MKTIEEILSYKQKAFDGRDISRLTNFLSVKQVEDLGLVLTSEEVRESHQPSEFTEENVKKCLERDLDFAFTKSLDKRGLSASFMVDVVSMWVWVLDDDVKSDPQKNYAQYGLPYLKAVALFYGFDNPIGDDRGDEYEYSAEYDEQWNDDD